MILHVKQCAAPLQLQRTKTKDVSCQEECQQHRYAIHDVRRTVRLLQLVKHPADVYTGLQCALLEAGSACLPTSPLDRQPHQGADKLTVLASHNRNSAPARNFI